jgi:hypothetical protein
MVEIQDLGQNQISEDEIERDRRALAKTSKFGRFLEGKTKVYICPPVHRDLNRCHVTMLTHSGVAPDRKGGFCVCLRRVPANQIFHEPFWKYLEPLLTWEDRAGEKHLIRTDEGCAICEMVARGELPESCRARSQSLWILVPVQYRPPTGAWQTLPFQPAPFLPSARVSGQLMDVLGTYKRLFDYNGATYVVIKRVGMGFGNTSYTVMGPDEETLLNKVSLTQEQRSTINTMLSPSGECYPFKIIRSLLKDREKQMQLVRGDVGPARGRYVEVEGPDPKADPFSEKPSTARSAPGSAPGSAPTPARAPGPAPAGPAPGPSPARKQDVGSYDAKQAMARTRALQLNLPCYGVDCDANVPECQRCELFDPCREACYGVEVPPPQAVAEKESEPKLTAKQAVVGQRYRRQDGTVVKIVGAARGKVYAETDDGTRVGLLATEELEGPVAEDEDIVSMLDKAVAEFSSRTTDPDIPF